MALRLLIIADDLTGALDCACEASAFGVGATVFRSAHALAEAVPISLPPVVAVSTGSRDGSEAAAITAMTQVCAVMPALEPAHVMKKVDSRLKGHIGAETRVLAQALGLTRVLGLPAIPDMGRVQRRGSVEGAGIDTAIDIAAMLPGLQTITPDILTAADIDRALDQSAGTSLLLGARGLAAALVARLWPDSSPHAAPKPVAPALFAIGSRDRITFDQITRLRERVAVDWLAAPDGERAGRAPVRSPLSVLQLTGKTGQNTDPLNAARRFAEAAADVMLQSRIATLLACGGQTADVLLARLGVARIDVKGALLPGVASGRIALPDGTSLQFLTKSGGFGNADTLVHLARMIDMIDNPAKIAFSS